MPIKSRNANEHHFHESMPLYNAWISKREKWWANVLNSSLPDDKAFVLTSSNFMLNSRELITTSFVCNYSYMKLWRSSFAVVIGLASQMMKYFTISRRTLKFALVVFVNNVCANGFVYDSHFYWHFWLDMPAIRNICAYLARGLHTARF